MIELDGTVRLPGIGSVKALGLTLAELHEHSGRLIEARPYKRFGSDGVPVFLQLSGEDIEVNVAAYRPVYVSGDVMSPGPITYRPGLTVRAAIASAGGARRGIAEVDRPRPQDEARLLGDRAISANEIAGQRMRQWRLEAELASDPDAPPPERADFPVTDASYLELLDIHRNLLKNTVKEQSEQYIFFGRTEKQLEERLAILNRQADTQRTAVEFDETEVSRVSSLFDRGIVPINRLIEIRRAQLASATRLLQTEDSLARVSQQQDEVRYDLELFESRRLGQILEQLHEVRQQLGEARLAYRSQAGQLAALNGWPSQQLGISAVIHRADSDDLVPAAMEAVLDPGDVLSVSVVLATDSDPNP